MVTTRSFTLASVRSSLAACDVSALDVDDVKVAIGEVRRTQRTLEALNLRLAQRSTQLAAVGASPDAGEALLGHGEVATTTARRDAARADVVDAMPGLGSALQTGTIGGDHLDSVARTLSRLGDRERSALVAQEPALVDAAERLPVDSFNRFVCRTAETLREDHGLTLAEKQRGRSELRTWIDRESGMGQIRASLEPARFTVVVDAIEREVGALANAGGVRGEAISKTPNLAAAALVNLVGHGNGARGRPSVSVIVDAQTVLSGPHSRSVRETVDGLSLPPETIDRFCCDAVVRRILFDERGARLDVGRAARTATDAQWALLKALYSTCAWTGCDRPISWCQAHHVREWEHGGPTDLDNLVPLCSKHHHAVHEGKWSIKVLPDRTLRIHQPDGRHHADARPDRLGDWSDRSPPAPNSAADP